jgi:anaerobic selenocysteine-containing dehydrogenase
MEFSYLEKQTKGGSKIPLDASGIEIKKTICSICNPMSHCGIDAYVKSGVVIKVEGTQENPHSAGTLCSKGAANRQYIYHKDRVLNPLLRTGKRGEGRFKVISWDEALDMVTERLNDIKAQAGPEAVVFYAGYPKWMRPFLKRLAHSFGSPNYCTESSCCSMAASMAAALNYGSGGRPDVPNCKCLLVWSTNPFYSNTSGVRNLVKAREKGLKIIDVGPLITPLTRHADIHLRIRPGTSGALALGMAHVIISEGLYDIDFVENWTHGFHEYAAYAQKFTPDVTENITGVPAERIKAAARLYATSKPSGMLNGANATTHHTNGVQNHRAITALIGLTGNYDIKGGNYVMPSSFLYVPNGLKTQQADFEQSRPWEQMPPRVGADRYPVWCRMIPEAQAMHIPHQIKSSKPYPIRALMGFGMNFRMWPGSDFMAEQLKKLDFLVVADLFMTDTAKMVDLVLPVCSSFERSELKFYMEQYVIWTQPAISPLGESRPDSDIIFDLAARLIPDDGLMQQGYEASLDWILKPSGLSIAKLSQYPAGYAVAGIKMPPYKKYLQEGFGTPSGKMEFSSGVLADAGIDPLPRFEEPKLSPVSAPKKGRKYPLILTTGARLPMFVHSRTFRLEWTRSLRPDPMLDMHPDDAEKRGIGQGDWLDLKTERNTIRVRANLTLSVPSGVVNMFHAYPEADVNLLIAPDYLDPISGFPGFKALLCEVKKI